MYVCIEKETERDIMTELPFYKTNRHNVFLGNKHLEKTRGSFSEYGIQLLSYFKKLLLLVVTVLFLEKKNQRC